MPKRDAFPKLAIDDLSVATLTKAQLIERLCERIGLNGREARDMVDAFFGTIAEALERGDDVRISSFGNFQVRRKSPRPGRNPRTGEEIPIAARRVVTFRAGQKLRRMIQEGPEDADHP